MQHYMYFFASSLLSNRIRRQQEQRSVCTRIVLQGRVALYKTLVLVVQEFTDKCRFLEEVALTYKNIEISLHGIRVLQGALPLYTENPVASSACSFAELP